MFAADLYKVESDLRTMGKGINNSYLPCGALGVTDRIIEVIHGLSLSGFTHAGHPLALAAVDAALNVYLEAHVGPRDRREHVSQGTLGAKTMGRITTRSLDRGLITRGRGSRVVFCPPITISRDEVDQALDIMFEVLGTLRND